MSPTVTSKPFLCCLSLSVIFLLLNFLADWPIKCTYYNANNLKVAISAALPLETARSASRSMHSLRYVMISLVCSRATVIISITENSLK